MKKRLIILVFLLSFVLISCSDSNKELKVESIEPQLEDIDMTKLDEHRVQLADETIVYSQGTSLDRAVLIKSLLCLKDIDSKIYHNNKATYIEVNGEYYSTIDFEKTELIKVEEFKIF